VKIASVVPVAKKLTVQEILADFEKYESTLVTIDNVTLSGNSGIYGGNVSLTDGTPGALTLFTKSGASPASFSTSTYPTPGPNTVTGVLQQFNGTYQISIRTTADVQ
jgi:DNA/RNA endonuclease YhcR with UshA esterase domain